MGEQRRQRRSPAQFTISRFTPHDNKLRGTVVVRAAAAAAAVVITALIVALWHGVRPKPVEPTAVLCLLMDGPDLSWLPKCLGCFRQGHVIHKYKKQVISVRRELLPPRYQVSRAITSGQNYTARRISMRAPSGECLLAVSAMLVMVTAGRVGGEPVSPDNSVEGTSATTRVFGSPMDPAVDSLFFGIDWQHRPNVDKSLLQVSLFRPPWCDVLSRALYCKKSHHGAQRGSIANHPNSSSETRMRNFRQNISLCGLHRPRSIRATYPMWQVTNERCVFLSSVCFPEPSESSAIHIPIALLKPACQIAVQA